MITANIKQIGELVCKIRDPNHQGVFGNTLLHSIVEFENSLEFIQKLIKDGANVNMTNFFGITPLHCAVIYRNRIAFKVLIQSGALINLKNYGGNTALHYSISNCMSPILHLNCSQVVYHHHSPDKWMIRELLQYETLDINARNNRGETPLMWAVACKQLDVVKALLGRDANVNVCDCNKRTPLHVASTDPKPNLDIIFELLFHGACIYCFDYRGDTPSDIIVQRFSNPKSNEIAEIFAKLIALMNEMNSFTVPKLEANSHLSLLLKRCSYELQRMKNSLITGDLSLLEFLNKDVNEKNEKGIKNFDSKVYKTVVEILISDNYSMYGDILIMRIPKFVLCEALVNFFSKTYLVGSGKERCFSLFSNLIINYCVSEYLSNTDMFNIILAIFAQNNTG